MSHSSKRTIIIGAGAGGITSALLARLRGEDVLLLEAHSALGGCASWFRRGSFVFDAGATTVSGVGVGEPLGDLFESIGRAPDLVASDPGIVFHLSSGKKLRYHRDFERWMQELEEKFPSYPHRPFWEKVTSLNRESWKLLKKIPTFPFRSLNDLLPAILYPQGLRLLPELLISTDHALKIFGLDHHEYRELVDGILLISAQSTSQHIPFLVGAMALAYPGETYAPRGGMKGLMDFFEKAMKESGVVVRTRSKVESFSPTDVTLSTGEKIPGERFIFNLPVWNLARMAEGPLQMNLSKDSDTHPGSWGAFTLYFGVKSQIHELYHQVHLNHPLVKNYFVSFSLPNEELRAPAGHQAVSISTHVFAEERILRDEIARIILDDFLNRFPVSDVKFLTTGVPKTFERYTGRMNGFVGGLPFLYGNNPLSMISPLTSAPSVFRIGDTVFPGQGLCGVTAGALSLHRRLG